MEHHPSGTAKAQSASKASAAGSAVTRPAARRQERLRPVGIQTARLRFKSLVLQYPNFFGNLPELGTPAIQPLSSNTSYEELACLGLQLQQERLDRKSTRLNSSHSSPSRMPSSA